MKCVDLAALAGTRYRLAHDPAAEHERGGKSDPWLLTIPCQRGHFYPHGAELVGFASNGRGPSIKAGAAIPGVIVTQDGTDGINVVFPPSLFAKVARLAKPRRRRQLTPEQKAAAVERLAKYAFPAARQAPENERQSVPTAITTQDTISDRAGPGGGG